MAVDQDVLPQDQGFAASFGEQAALQGFVFGGREGVDVAAELVINRDVQFVSLTFMLLSGAFAVRMLHHVRIPPKQVDIGDGSAAAGGRRALVTAKTVSE
jgi:hypothetical protein